jgi:hypothetical protein
MRIAQDRRWPLKNAATEMWNSCDPFLMKEVSMWHSTYSSSINASVSIVIASIYMIQFTETNSSELLAVRQAYWTSGNIRDLLRD